MENKNFFYYSNNLPFILQQAGCSILISTYQAGKLIFVSSVNGETLTMYAKNFRRPMGIAFDSNNSKLAVASNYSLDVFSANGPLSFNYPDRQGHYDKLFIPQSRYYTGFVDTHEIAFGNEGIWTINTKFSALTLMSDDKHFDTSWKPPFISGLFPEDRCHLNGMAMVDGHPKFVSMFSETDKKEGWKRGDKNTGLLMDIETEEVLCSGLYMPHSPVYKDEKIYFLQSGTGQVMELTLKNRSLRVVAEMNSFVRGLEVIGDYLVVGTSVLREKSTSFGQLPISEQETYCGIYILDRHSGENLGGLSYTDVVKEIFSVKVLFETMRPGLLTERDEYFNRSIMADENVNFWLESNKAQEEES